MKTLIAAILIVVSSSAYAEEVLDCGYPKHPQVSTATSDTSYQLVFDMGAVYLISKKGDSSARTKMIVSEFPEYAVFDVPVTQNSLENGPYVEVVKNKHGIHLNESNALAGVYIAECFK